MKTRTTAAIAALLSVAGAASAQTASAQIREGDVLANNNTVTNIAFVTINGIGGTSWNLTTEDDANDLISTFWGNVAGGANAILRTEGVVDDIAQGSFETRFGMSDGGDLFYSALGTRVSDGATGIDNFFRNDTLVWAENDSHGFDAANPFISFASAPGMTNNGIGFGVLGFTDVSGGSSQNRGLLVGNNVVLKGGDSVGGTADLVRTQASNIAFDSWVSALGSNYITEVQLEGDTSLNNAVVVNGSIYTTLGGGQVREGQAVSAAAGGLAGEVWDDYDMMSVNEAGDVFFTGDTSLGDVLVKNGEILLREGSTVSTSRGSGTIDGTIEAGRMSEDGDWATVWDVDVAGDNLEALIVNGDVVLLQGDAVDWNGDGVIDAADNGAFVEDFNVFSGVLAVTTRDGDAFDVSFAADIEFADGSILEGGFTITIPAPGTAALAGLAGIAGLRRRR